MRAENSRGNKDYSPFPHEQNPLISKQTQAWQTRESEQSQSKEKQAQAILKSSDIIPKQDESVSIDNTAREAKHIRDTMIE